MGPLRKERGELVTSDVEKAKVLNYALPQSSLARAPGTLLKSQKKMAELEGKTAHCE